MINWPFYWKQRNYSEDEIEIMHFHYSNSHNYFRDGYLCVRPMQHSRESFKDKVLKDRKFARKWR